MCCVSGIYFLKYSVNNPQSSSFYTPFSCLLYLVTVVLISIRKFLQILLVKINLPKFIMLSLNLDYRGVEIFIISMRVSDHNKIKHISVLQIIIGLDCPKPEILRNSRVKYFRVIISFEISYFLNSDLIFRWSLFSDPKVISTYRRKILFSSIYYRVIKYVSKSLYLHVS